MSNGKKGKTESYTEKIYVVKKTLHREGNNSFSQIVTKKRAPYMPIFSFTNLHNGFKS